MNGEVGLADVTCEPDAQIASERRSGGGCIAATVAAAAAAEDGYLMKCFDFGETFVEVEHL